MPIAFAPLRRSAVIFPAPDGVDTGTWPLVWSEPHRLYFRAEPTGILFSPMDETPQPPSDVPADDVMVALSLSGVTAAAVSPGVHKIEIGAECQGGDVVSMGFPTNIASSLTGVLLGG